MCETLAVRGIEGVENLAPVCDRCLHRQRAFQRHAVDELHHDVIVANVVNLTDILLVESCDGPRFSFELRRELRLQDLQGNIPVKPCVARLPDLFFRSRIENVQSDSSYRPDDHVDDNAQPV
jgi:hypothetical protein